MKGDKIMKNIIFILLLILILNSLVGCSGQLDGEEFTDKKLAVFIDLDRETKLEAEPDPIGDEYYSDHYFNDYRLSISEMNIVEEQIVEGLGLYLEHMSVYGIQNLNDADEFDFLLTITADDIQYTLVEDTELDPKWSKSRSLKLEKIEVKYKSEKKIKATLEYKVEKTNSGEELLHNSEDLSYILSEGDIPKGTTKNEYERELVEIMSKDLATSILNTLGSKL